MAANQAHRDDNLLEDIQSRLETLNKSERKVAEAACDAVDRESIRGGQAKTTASKDALTRAADVEPDGSPDDVEAPDEALAVAAAPPARWTPSTASAAAPASL